MPDLIEAISSLFSEILAAALAILSGLVSYKTYKQESKIQDLTDEITHLKRINLQISGKVNPESDRELISKAEESIDILGTNALGTLHHCREELIEFLRDKKGRLHILVLDPAGRYIEKRMDSEGDVVGRIRTEWAASAKIIKDIWSQVRHVDNLEIRLYDAEPTRRLTIVDASDERPYKSRMLINYYPKEQGRRGYEGGQFLSERSLLRDRDSFDLNLNHFQDLWSRATFVDIKTL